MLAEEHPAHHAPADAQAEAGAAMHAEQQNVCHSLAIEQRTVQLTIISLLPIDDAQLNWHDAPRHAINPHA